MPFDPVRSLLVEILGKDDPVKRFSAAAVAADCRPGSGATSTNASTN